MAFRGIILQQQLLLGLLILTATTTSQSHSSCINRCGSVSIPYPFGTRDGCYLDKSFLITCNHTFEPPRPFLRRSNIIVRDISLDGELRVSTFIARDCYNKSGTSVIRKRSGSVLNLSKFPISYTKNKFTALGCDTYVIIKGRAQGQNYTTGCISLCDSIESVNDGSCSGIGCCQTSIPEGVANFSVSLGSFNNHSAVLDFNPCSFGFVVEEKEYKFSPSDLKNLENIESVPVVLDWAVGNETCEVAKRNSKSFACKAENSTCYASNNGPGYRCNCSSGFRGNPYLLYGCVGTNIYFYYNPFFIWLNLVCCIFIYMLIEYLVMGCIVFQMLMSAKIQTPAPKNAIISLGVSIAIVQKGTKAMG